MPNINEIMKDLQNPNYWDLQIIGNHRTLQLRQQWDRETCILIRDKIIESLKQLEQKDKALDEIREYTKPIEITNLTQDTINLEVKFPSLEKPIVFELEAHCYMNIQDQKLKSILQKYRVIES